MGNKIPPLATGQTQIMPPVLKDCRHCPGGLLGRTVPVGADSMKGNG